MSTAAYVEVDAKLKGEAEKVLDKIGLSFTQAVDLFTRQIVLHHAFPVELEAKKSKPLCLDDMTEEDFIAEFAKGMDDIKNGRCYTSEEMQERIEKRYGINF